MFQPIVWVIDEQAWLNESRIVRLLLGEIRVRNHRCLFHKLVEVRLGHLRVCVVVGSGM